MMKIFFGIMCLIIGRVQGYPSILCPRDLSISGFTNDLGLLADVVSWENTPTIKGVCGVYEQIFEKHGEYDTRMRIYKNNVTNDVVFVFRPTQQTSEGGDIHNNRKLSACRYMNGSCYGLVNDRFQEAFITLTEDLGDDFFESLPVESVSTVGHSLGGSFQLMMGIYLYSMYSIVPKYMLGFAGPFIGDVVFTETYQYPLKDELQDKWWQIETVDLNNPSNYDGTVEGYNVNVPAPGNDPWEALNPFVRKPPEDVVVNTPIYIQEDAICRFEIFPLSDSYGMHDMKNYRLTLTGTDC